MKSYPYAIKILKPSGEVENALVTGDMPWAKEYGCEDTRLIARMLPNGLVSHGMLNEGERILETIEDLAGKPAGSFKEFGKTYKPQ